MKTRQNIKLLFITLSILTTALTLFFIQFCASDSGLKVSENSAKCIECHQKNEIHELQIEEWKKSKMARAGVGCFECHQTDASAPDALDHYNFTISVIVSPSDCAKCHERQYTQFSKSKHASAAEILFSSEEYKYLAEAVGGEKASPQGCQSCHGSIVKIKERAGVKSFTTDSWPNLGIGRMNPDGSKGTCSGCHSKHRFSLKVARTPESCGKCHMGPDYPQLEIFKESKHGINYDAHKDEMDHEQSFWALGIHYTTQAPNCVTCHMGATKDLENTHDTGERLSWDLRSPISEELDNAKDRRDAMKMVCANCHSPQWIKNFYKQFDNTVENYNEVFAKPAKAIMDELKKAGKLTKTPFDEEIEWTYFKLWHNEGRLARTGAAMMGPDYVQWQGFHQLSQTFYLKLIPQARALGIGKFLDQILARPEHAWRKGVKNEKIQERMDDLAEWQEVRKLFLEKEASEAKYHNVIPKHDATTAANEEESEDGIEGSDASEGKEGE